MAQLAQAYIHLKPYAVSDRKARALGKFAEKIALKAAREIYGPDVVVETEIEEGSLILRVTAAGVILLGTYSAIADYKGFKESIVEICKDAREFAVDICDPFAKKAGVAKDDIYRFERRLKTPGKLYRVSKRLEKLESAVGELKAQDIASELANARAELTEALQDLSDEERRLVERHMVPIGLPPPEQWPIPVEPLRIAVLKSDEDLQLFEDEPEGDAAPKRRVLFRSRKKTTGGKKPKKRRKRTAQTELLLIDRA